jgi:hypothetical protein
MLNIGIYKIPHLLLLGFFILFNLFNVSAQINIDDVGDNWKQTVTRAIENVKQTDSLRYNILINTCTKVSFWNGDYSTTEDGNTILISQKDMKLNSLNNISAVLVHESYHLWVKKLKFQHEKRVEELLAYIYEQDFLSSIPNVEDYLLKHVDNMIEFYR